MLRPPSKINRTPKERPAPERRKVVGQVQAPIEGQPLDPHLDARQLQAYRVVGPLREIALWTPVTVPGLAYGPVHHPVQEKVRITVRVRYMEYGLLQRLAVALMAGQQ